MRTKTIQAAGPRGPQFDNEQPVPADLAERLYRAGEGRVADIVAGFSATQRADLAVYCYHKAHLHRIGLAIAATCERTTLELTWGRTLGKALFDQSRELTLASTPATNSYRPAVTLATLSAMQAELNDEEDWTEDDELPPVTH
jgi:hypothetical protein